MSKIIFVFLFTFLSYSAFSQVIVRLDKSSITAQQLDDRISQLMKDASVAGMAVSVYNDNKTVYHKAFGYKNADTKTPLQTSTNFYGASLSKSVFAVLVMKLVEEKIISLDKPLQDYLPKPVYEYGKGTSWNQDYTALKEDKLYQKITARHCLTHSSGFANWRWDESDQKLRVRFEPGSNYSYSGEGLCYLQFVIEKTTGKLLNELMQEKLFGPLGMNNSSYPRTRPRCGPSTRPILSTARDIIYLWVARMIMSGLEFPGDVPFRDVYIHSVIQAPRRPPHVEEPRHRHRPARGDRRARRRRPALRPAGDVARARTSASARPRFSRAATSPTSSGTPPGSSCSTRATPRPTARRPRRPRTGGSSRGWSGGDRGRRRSRHYDFAHAALELYRFVWSELCDWYLEIVKPRSTTATRPPPRTCSTCSNERSRSPIRSCPSSPRRSGLPARPRGAARRLALSARPEIDADGPRGRRARGRRRDRADPRPATLARAGRASGRGRVLRRAATGGAARPWSAPWRASSSSAEHGGEAVAPWARSRFCASDELDAGARRGAPRGASRQARAEVERGGAQARQRGLRRQGPDRGGRGLRAAQAGRLRQRARRAGDERIKTQRTLPGRARAVGWKLGLERMQELAPSSVHPERAFRSLHVVGTNGKTSVTVDVGALLAAQGMRTGACVSRRTSWRWAERTRIGDASPSRLRGRRGRASRSRRA